MIFYSVESSLTFNPSSSQHVQKLRKTRDTNGITAAAGGSTTVATPSKSTPAKTPKSTGGRKRAAPNSAKVKDEIAKEDDDDDIFDQLIKKEEAMSEVEDTPTKPSKRARMKSATYVFTETVTKPLLLFRRH